MLGSVRDKDSQAGWIHWVINSFKKGLFLLFRPIFVLFSYFFGSSTSNNNYQGGTLVGQIPASSQSSPVSLVAMPPQTSTANSFSTPGREQLPLDLNAFTGKELLQEAIQKLIEPKLKFEEAEENYSEARQRVNQAEIKSKNAIQNVDNTEAQKNLTITQKVRDACGAELIKQYSFFIANIAKYYEGISKDNIAMDGIKKLNPQEIEILVNVFEYLMMENLLTDQRVFKIASLFEKNKILLMALSDIRHLGTKIEAPYLDKILEGVGEINLINIHGNLQYIPVPGDGNCMYSSVLYYLKQPFENSQELRRKMAKYIKRHSEQYQNAPFLRDGKQYKSMDDYLLALEYSKDWAEQYDVHILMDMLNRPIVIIGPEGKIRNIADVKAKRKNTELLPIFIYYNDHNHYSSLIVKGDRDPNAILDELLQRSKPQKSNKDDAPVYPNQ
jgi:hypothetical protein